MSQSMRLPYFAFVVLGTAWGSNFFFMKAAVTVIDPMQVACLRALFGAIPILIYALIRKSLRWRDFKHSKHFLAMSVFAVAIPFMSFVMGARTMSGGAAGAISGTIPLMTAMMTALFLKEEKLGIRKITGLFLGFAGVALVAQVQNLFLSSSEATHTLVGALFMLLGAFGYACAMVYARKFIVPLHLSSVALATYQILFASVIMALLTPWHGVTAILNAPTALTGVVMGLGLCGTGLAFICYYYLIEKMGAATASSVFYLPPVVALLVGSFIAHESLDSAQLFGTLVILVGVYLAR